jgi:hypothetical protein
MNVAGLQRVEVARLFTKRVFTLERMQFDRPLDEQSQEANRSARDLLR